MYLAGVLQFGRVEDRGVVGVAGLGRGVGPLDTVIIDVVEGVEAAHAGVDVAAILEVVWRAGGTGAIHSSESAHREGAEGPESPRALLSPSSLGGRLLAQEPIYVFHGRAFTCSGPHWTVHHAAPLHIVRSPHCILFCTVRVQFAARPRRPRYTPRTPHLSMTVSPNLTGTSEKSWL